jgi:poly(hydroxyalkanoate) depolymerase family esterase
MAFSEETTPDVDGITDTIQTALTAAGLNAHSESMQSVTNLIRQTLSGCRISAPSTSADRATIVLPGSERIRTRPFLPTSAQAGRAEQQYPGEFANRAFTSAAGTLNYKLYIPLSYAARPAEKFPLIVMLHGCTQSPDDFAAGTRMNELAETHGFLVVYPAQAATANGAKCWNWFRPEDQARDRGEPSLIASTTQDVAGRYRVDERRIFVAGLSAGAAMSVVLGATYPELYAAVGAHSGLAYGAAHDTPSALGAMRGGSPAIGTPNVPGRQVRHPSLSHSVPTIVFHGTGDGTVNVRNGMDIIDQATMSGKGKAHLHLSVEPGVASNGGTYTRTVYADENRRPVIEHWLLHGAGHAWSGGSSRGSFTDPRGPDASSEMIRFFYSQQAWNVE